MTIMATGRRACDLCLGWGRMFDGYRTHSVECWECAGTGEYGGWRCLCGASNRLRDRVCRNCGAHKPKG